MFAIFNFSSFCKVDKVFEIRRCEFYRILKVGSKKIDLPSPIMSVDFKWKFIFIKFSFWRSTMAAKMSTIPSRFSFLYSVSLSEHFAVNGQFCSVTRKASTVSDMCLTLRRIMPMATFPVIFRSSSTWIRQSFSIWV